MANEYTLSLSASEIDKILVNSVLSAEQTLTEAQKLQVRKNIGASSIYVGSGDMPEGTNIQVDPTGSNFDFINRNSISLGVHSDGLIYLFVDGNPIGTGVLAGGADGEVIGRVEEDNSITLSGALPAGAYTVKYAFSDGSYLDLGKINITSTNVNETDILKLYEYNINKRFSADAIDYVDTPGVLSLCIPFADIVGKAIKLTGFEYGAKYGTGSTAKWYHFDGTKRGDDFGAGYNLGFWNYEGDKFSVTEQTDGSYICQFTDPASYGDSVVYINIVVLTGGVEMTEEDLADKRIEFVRV